VNNLKENRRCWNLKDEALDRTFWRDCFATGGNTDCAMNEYFFPNRMTPNTEITENSAEGYLFRPLVHLIKAASVIQIIATFLNKIY
jgi:hypothetical protein